MHNKFVYHLMLPSLSLIMKIVLALKLTSYWIGVWNMLMKELHKILNVILCSFFPELSYNRKK